jgi:ferric iron reductase protein FhuF
MRNLINYGTKMNPLNSTLWVCLKRSSTTPFMAVLVWNWWSTMCGSLSTRNVEKVFTPHIIIQYLYISLYISYLYISLHISTYIYIRVHDNRAFFVDVLLVGTSSRHLSRMIPGMATEYWPRLICLERVDLIRSLWSKYWYIQIIHIPVCTAVVLHMPTIERAFAHATCHVWP